MRVVDWSVRLRAHLRLFLEQPFCFPLLLLSSSLSSYQCDKDAKWATNIYYKLERTWVNFKCAACSLFYCFTFIRHTHGLHWDIACVSQVCKSSRVRAGISARDNQAVRLYYRYVCIVIWKICWPLSLFYCNIENLCSALLTTYTCGHKESHYR